MYSLLFDNDKEEKKAKGIVKNVVEKDLRHEMYSKTLQSGKQMHSKMKVIRSDNHQIYTMSINKISLSPYDDKRYLLCDGVRSYAYGHYNTLID